jgi:AcrR family transcriptional regulator
VVRGFDRVTIRDIGDEAGLTNPALYRHYRGKEELGLDLYRRCYRVMVAALQDAAATKNNALDKLLGYVPALIGLYEASPSVVLYVDEHQVRFWPQLRHEFEPQTLSTLVMSWVDEAQSAGTVRSDASVAALAALPMGLVTQWTAIRATGLATMQDAVGLAGLVQSAVLQPNER